MQGQLTRPKDSLRSDNDSRRNNINNFHCLVCWFVSFWFSFVLCVLLVVSLCPNVCTTPHVSHGSHSQGHGQGNVECRDHKDSMTSNSIFKYLLLII